MPRWTSDQEAAIVSRHANLLVSAAAGSGKTAVLVERIIRLIIEDQTPIDQMLIVTFTNAAASEMRERIIEALYSKLEEGDNYFLREQINNIQKASIMTLHAFCIGVIRNNAHFIDTDPGFKIGDTIELNILISEAIDHVLEEAYESEDEMFHTFVESYSENRTDQKLQNLILSTYRFIQSQPEPLDWLTEAVDQLQSGKEYVNILMDHLNFDLENCLEVLESAVTLTEHPDGPLEYYDMIQSDLKHVEKLRALMLEDMDLFVDYLRSINHMRLKSISKARKEEVNETIVEETKFLRKHYKGLLDDMKHFFEHKLLSDYLEDIHTIEPMMFQLYKLVKAFDEKYSLLKTDKNILDFNDLEHKALRALKFKDVQKLYQNRYRHLFFDEYQDSNLVQETIVNAIKREDNVFLVGDVKQSIYRFRLADPSLFMSKYTSYSKDETAVNRLIVLKKNFRSRDNILYGINFLFENIMSEKFGEMVYDDDAKLYPGIDFGSIEHPEIKINIIDGKYEGEDHLKALTTAEVEAHSIVKEIKELIGSKSYNRKKDEYFEVAYKHIVILMRAVSAWTPVFNDIFMKEKIPLFADNQGGYFDTLEIKMFVDLLRLIDNPLQDLPLLTVMRSPIFDFTTDDLIAIRINHPKGFYYDAVTAYDLEDALGQKIINMQQLISEWKKQMLYMNLDELMWKIMMKTGFYQYVGAMPGGKNRQGNLRLLIDRAEQQNSTSFRGLFNFITMVDKMKKANTEIGTAKIIGENEDVVRIMSIHKSKGLEFPIVIVAGMGKKFNLRDAYQDILMHKNVGLGPKFVDPINRVYFETLPKKLIKRMIKFESLAEEMRVLYVALTRAVDRLILVGTVKGLDSNAQKWTRGVDLYNLVTAQSYLDWTMMALSKHPVSKSVWDLANKPYLGLKSHETLWEVAYQDREELLTDSENICKEGMDHIFEHLEDFNDVEVNDFLNKEFSYCYPFQNAQLLPSKFSVSELKALKNQSMEALSFKSEPLNVVPDYLKTESKKTRAEIGTLMHFVMQKLNRADMEIDKQIEKLVMDGFVEEDALKYVDQSKLKSFFESDLGKRYRKALSVHKEKAFVLSRPISEILEDKKSDDEILIQGIIDCYFEEDGEIVLIDYKTDYLYGDEEVLVSRYREQLDLYKEAIESITHKKVKESYIYSFFKNKSISVK